MSELHQTLGDKQMNHQNSTATNHAVRDLTLAHAAIKHALYFLEIDAEAQASSYCSYAAEHLQRFATGLIDQSQAEAHRQQADVVLKAMNALACH
ncbi:MAG: hypothetical protein VKL39_01595 [Leptolyngbyaceae bacterium]|nr:hypothetical protein [Leptolyngbyaceae bacterium]